MGKAHHLRIDREAYNLGINFVEPVVVARMTVCCQCCGSHPHHTDAKRTQSAIQVGSAWIPVKNESDAAEAAVIQGWLIAKRGIAQLQAVRGLSMPEPNPLLTLLNRFHTKEISLPQQGPFLFLLRYPAHAIAISLERKQSDHAKHHSTILAAIEPGTS